MTGKVTLVGAGPGDAGLITVKGQAALEAADVVVYDRLVPEELLWGLEAELIDAGKAASCHRLSQDEINRLLASLAREGKNVVRLKGGDPFLFGRGAEEALYLLGEGVPVEAVPGLSSALAVPASAGIPVTHRGVSAQVHVLTWHGFSGEEPEEASLRAAAGAGGTVVILMAASALGRNLGSRLLEAGFAPELPAAVIEQGALPEQRTRLFTVRQLAETPPEAASPALLVLGEVCGLRPELAPSLTPRVRPAEGVSEAVESGLAAGSRVVVTRAQPENSARCAQLRKAGLRPIPLPCIRRQVFANALEALSVPAASYAWIAFTSPAGAEVFFEQYLAGGEDIRSLAGVRFAACGPATAAALRRRGVLAAFTPETDYGGEALGRGLGERLRPGDKVLLAQAERSAGRLERVLAGRGFAFDILPLYRTVPIERVNPAVRALVEQGRFDAVDFASPSAVSAFAALFPRLDPRTLPAHCLGKTTAAQAAALRTH